MMLTVPFRKMKSRNSLCILISSTVTRMKTRFLLIHEKISNESQAPIYTIMNCVEAR